MSTLRDDIMDIADEAMLELCLGEWKGFTQKELVQAFDDGTVTLDDIGEAAKKSVIRGLKVLKSLTE